MSSRRSHQRQAPRELRRRVVVAARLRHGASWSDACILNISSRGLMIHSGRPIARGNSVELRRGDHVIVAEVVWRDGARAGLRSEDRLPVEQIMSLSHAPVLQAAARTGERRRRKRPEEESRLRGRAMEFAGVVAIAVMLAGAGLAMVQAAFARPLARVSSVLGP